MLIRQIPKRVHQVKSVNPSFSDMHAGLKKFEVLFDPKGDQYRVLDTIIFVEHNHMMKETGRTVKFYINYIFTGEPPLMEGMAVVLLERFPDLDTVLKEKSS